MTREIAITLGKTQPINGSWLVAICDVYGATSAVNGSWIVAWAQAIGVSTTTNGSWIEAIARDYGATEPANGSWMKAIYDRIVLLYWNYGYTEGGYILNDTEPYLIPSYVNVNYIS